MKWIVSLQRTAKWCKRQEAFIAGRLKNKEEKNNNLLVGWGHVNLVRGQKAQLAWCLGITGYSAVLAKQVIHRDVAVT